jgi:hypothetical protein
VDLEQAHAPDIRREHTTLLCRVVSMILRMLAPVPPRSRSRRAARRTPLVHPRSQGVALHLQATSCPRRGSARVSAATSLRRKAPAEADGEDGAVTDAKHGASVALVEHCPDAIGGRDGLPPGRAAERAPRPAPP